jgi:ABC-2 type transport system ATP-binding protein
MSPSAIRIRDLRVVRGGALVLSDLSCEVAAGSVTGLLGPSGSGKSTLMRALVGVQKIAGGSIDVLGNAAGSASLRTRIGYMTQAPSVYGDLTVRENLMFFGRIVGVPDATNERVLAQVALGEHRDRSSRASPAGSERASRSPRRCSARPSCLSSTSHGGTRSRPAAGSLGALPPNRSGGVRRCSCRAT